MREKARGPSGRPRQFSTVSSSWPALWRCAPVGDMVAGQKPYRRCSIRGIGTAQGSNSRAILEIAEASVLAKGFGARRSRRSSPRPASPRAGSSITSRTRTSSRGGHDAALRRAERPRVRRHLRARQRLSDDPLQAFLIWLKLLAEPMAELPGGHPGCLIASVCYQERLFDRDVVELAAQSWQLERPLPRPLDRIAAMLSAARTDRSRRSGRHAFLRRRRRHHHVEDTEGPAPAGAAILPFGPSSSWMFLPALPVAAWRTEAIAAE